MTELTLATHPLTQALTGVIFVALDHAAKALQSAQHFLDEHPVDLSLFMGFVAGPDGRPVLLISALWVGAAAAGKAVMNRLERLDGAQMVGRRWCPMKDTFDPEVEKAYPKGSHYHLLTRNLRRLDPAVIDMLVEGGRRMPSNLDSIILHDFHGTPTHLAPDATAFPLRDPHFVVEIIAHWRAGSEEEGTAARAWAEQLSAELSTVSLAGGYASLLAPTEERRIRDFYGPAVPRLLQIKKQLDPQDLFRSGIGRLAG